MEKKDRSRVERNKTARLLITAGAFGMALGACTSEHASTHTTGGKRIEPCAVVKTYANAETHVQPVNPPFATLTRQEEDELDLLASRTRTNGGAITFNEEAGTYITFKDNELRLSYDANDPSGSTVDVSMTGGKARLSLGTEVCNGPLGAMYPTNFIRMTGWFVTHSDNFSS